MYRVKRDLDDFSAAHRLINGYVGKCQNLHGHNYKVQVVLESKKLDHTGFVIDFSVIKQLFNHWVQNNWDHVTLVLEEDTPLLEFLQKQEMKYFSFANIANTTVEALSEYLFQIFDDILSQFQHIDLYEVTIKETANCCASFCR